MTAKRTTAPTRHRVALRILDHQVVGPGGELLGNVDDLGLAVDGDRWTVTGLQIGPAALGRGLPGKLGTWVIAIWRRLHPDPHPRASFVPIAEVSRIGAAIEVSARAATGLSSSFGLERWLDEFVVSRIPGAKGGGDERAGSGGSSGRPEPGGSTASRRPLPDDDSTTSVNDVLGARVFADDGSELGLVHDLVCVESSQRGPQGGLRVTHVVYGLHASGSRLGYDADPRQGPLVVAALVRWWQRAHRVAPLEDVRVTDLDARSLRVASHDAHVHPHEL
ncbi:hypothetical protein SAMN04489867_2463 [Pedococcus dokdonensis]|uniref:PRC-barrel domain-containing protein n=1 Tax=Pedococcus dokdonensis TaxID=443156 RepID=A0A1H0SQA3_9MICO|nr:hypothetical protein [Pedococcus dokdonensis]SDP43937.1 hypothetical protein SAMN04489867_2463 [Pedococcus dokdonensis]